MTDNCIELKSINDILKENFHIPSYQRGYRWESQQVEDLLDDIWEFKQRPNPKVGEFYCLQPVVVTKKDDQWELIDGQQRLTTIYIILSYINNNVFKNANSIFNIEFATRPDSQNFLESIDLSKKEKNIDYYYVCEAFEKIKIWFEEKGNPTLVAMQFYPELLENTKIIWYEVNDGSIPVNIFTRINLGKIRLTNAELIKALFLSRENFTDVDNDKIRLKQFEIASEWDRIEYAMQNDEFWFFLNNEIQPSTSRIELLFDLMSDKQINNDEYFTFRYFNGMFKNSKDSNREEKILKVWSKVKKFYLTFEEWFNDRQFYHLIGYLITIGVKINEIKSMSDGLLKSKFTERLDAKIKEQVDFDISQLNYEDDWDKLTKILLLFNIITELQNTESNNRFPFNRYKGNGDKKFQWSLEHIHAQNSDGLNKREQWISWLKTHKESLERIDSIEYSELINEISEKVSLINEGLFKELSAKVLQVFRDVQKEDKMHGIHNLALLDRDTNSALNCSIFEVKRNIIIEREIKGSFIPVCTRNVFLKYYSRPAKDLYYWSIDDRENYFTAIQTTLKSYLTYHSLPELIKEV